MPEVHARLSASGAKRWMACPPSVRMEESFEDGSSEYAEEGTFAHKLAELLLRYNNDEISKKAFTTRHNKMKTDPFYNSEMQDYIEDYARTVWEAVNEVRAKCPDALVLFEQRLDFSEYVPEGFGTGDVVIVADDLVNIIDLKYGKGVGVSAKDNPQLRLYGLGAYLEHSMLYDIRRVRMTIIQPRLENVSVEELSTEELIEWAETEVKEKAALAMAGEGSFLVGDHCRFCKARATCRARAEYNMELAKLEFEIPELLSDEEIGEVLRRSDDLVRWAKDIGDYAYQKALMGTIFDGWKLVEGRSVRKYTDETVIAEVLEKEGFQDEQYHKLVGVTDLEKLLGKKQFETLLTGPGYVIKPEGKPVLVPEMDKRPAISTADSAKGDFSDTFSDEEYNCMAELMLLEAIPPHKSLEHYLTNMKEKYKEDVIRKSYNEIVK
ncbi:MAG: DUF2800 domain-containing protein [Clostridium sp.]